LIPDANAGSDGAIITGCDYGSWLARTYMTFDLSVIPQGEGITSAVLHLYQYEGMGYGSAGVAVFYINNDTWDESAITWNNRPDGGSYGSQIAFNENGGWYQGWSTWDLLVTRVWDPSVDRSDGALTIMLKEFENGDQGHNFRSRNYQYSAYLPYLEVVTNPPCDCDLNHDGRCDMRDWVLFGRSWGRTNCPLD